MSEFENPEKNIATKELIIQFLGFIKLISIKWRIWLASMLFGACISLILDFYLSDMKSYRSTITFNLEQGGNNQNQFGNFGFLNQNNVSGGELFSSQNFPELVRSRAVIERALMKTVVVNSDSLLMINYMTDSSDIKTNEWGGSIFRKPNTDAIGYKLVPKGFEDFTPLENSIISAVYEKVKEATLLDALGTSTSIMILTSNLTNELLVKKWVETLLETYEEFYIEMKTKKTRELLKHEYNRIALIESKLNSTDSRMARLNFENPNVVDPRGRMFETQITRKTSFLSTQYVAQLNKIEAYERTLLEETPIFTIIEESRLPLDTGKIETAGLHLKISSLAFFFISILLISVYDSFVSIMKD
jgi:hypothetical protein